MNPINNLPSDVFCWPMVLEPYTWRFIESRKPDPHATVIMSREKNGHQEKHICTFTSSEDGDFWLITAGCMTVQLPIQPNDKWTYFKT